jgi:uncharacterized protein YutE (UPF0331/DUF86 family)
MDSERAALARVAEQYAAMGYEVIIAPETRDLPTFARGFHVDLLARKGDRGIVVIAKKNRAALREDKTLSRLAEFINAQPGWRFDLVVVEPTSPIDEAEADAQELSGRQLKEMLDHVEESARSGDELPAYVLAWSALEAALRLRVREAVAEGQKILSPTVLIRMLGAEGHLSSREMKTLDKYVKMRNQVVHGFAPPKIAVNDVLYLVSLARRLMTKKKATKDD